MGHDRFDVQVVRVAVSGVQGGAGAIHHLHPGLVAKLSVQSNKQVYYDRNKDFSGMTNQRKSKDLKSPKSTCLKTELCSN